MRQVNTLLDKGGNKMHKVERLYYRIVKCYVLDKCNRRLEALSDVDEIVKEILDSKVNDIPLLEQADTIMQEIGCYEKLLVLREKLQQMNPNDKQTAIKLFTQYTFMNEYQKMSGMANKIAMSFQEKEFGLYSVQALYMLSQTKNSLPMNIDLALAFIEKQRQTNYKDENKPLPQYFVTLYSKILVAKGKYEQALEYLKENEQSFGMILDQKRLIYSLKYKQGDIEGVIQELTQIIKSNYNNVNEFQSIYDHHEFLISLIVNQLKKQSSTIIDQAFVESLDQQNIPEDGQQFQPFDFNNALDSLRHLYASFKKYESLDLDNKTTNYHNCRKSSILSQLLLKNKLILSLFSDQNEINQFIEEGIQSYRTLIIQYALRYLELNSMAFDLYPFIPILNEQIRRDILDVLRNHLESVENPQKNARCTINLHKVKKVFGLFGEDQESLMWLATQMQTEYFKFIQQDGAPEKGERKLADDQVIIMNEVLGVAQSKDSIDALVLYRIAILEYALEISPYNFDISLALLKIYDTYGLSTSFNQIFQSLGVKGVQLESLGFLALRHSIDWQEQNIFKSFLLKYNKYSKMNSLNLKQSKMKALTDLNFDQIENFVEYEDYLNNSYFSQMVRSFNNINEFSENIKTQQEFAKGFFENISEQLANENKQVAEFENQNLNRKRRTQDLKIVMHQYDKVQQFKHFRNSEQQWQSEFQKDMILREITQNDKLYSFYKYDRKSNYKQNLHNSLGFLELPETFAILHSLMTLLSQIQITKAGAEVVGLINKFQMQFEVYQKQMIELDIETREDITPRYSEMLKEFNTVIGGVVVNTLEVVKRFSQIEKREGQSGEETAQKILTVKEQCQNLASQLTLKTSQDQRSLFLQVMLGSTFIPLTLDLLSETLKSLLPSSKKKKKSEGPTSLDEVQTHILNPLKQAIKDLSAYFQSPAFINIESDYIAKREAHLHSLISEQSNHYIKELLTQESLATIIKRKILEIAKEEKLQKERRRDQSLLVSKRLKDITSTGVFQ
ncbi:UNKNOWN [Stylonychia lemnae]|uniref:Uncharacterized protein n=1 Tax=Stylonychia lemnae TaxID=5949 RepID=A0A077ZW04_STYLE|nr:UNKNOWN [Stylonychia lemnae]|eukprot:CDW74130.1 UNKNOWN [Stylonychia lemnae]